MTEVAGREREIARAMGKIFVQRRDVKAVQNEFTGTWAKRDEPIKMQDVISHIQGKASIGHYLLDHDNKCRVFALDVDLVDTKMGNLKDNPDPAMRAKYKPLFFPANPAGPSFQLTEYNPREAWQDRSHASRAWTKQALKFAAEEIAGVIVKELELPCLVSYSGSKGVHIYAILHEDLGGPGPMPAEFAREGAIMVLEKTGKFIPGKGKNFYRAMNQDPVTGLPQLEVEVFPKQGSIGKEGYGNLMRLPLGRNFKSEKDVSFFMDLDGAKNEFHPIDPLAALYTCNPFAFMDDWARGEGR